MKDSLAIRRLKRLTMIGLGHFRYLLWKLLPFLVAFSIGAWFGMNSEGMRIHNDCKFTGTFRLSYTGYTCRIGG